jgi:hypothetical protein
MSENFECDFSEGSVNEKKPIIKKRQSEKEIHSSYTNSDNLNSSRHFHMREDINKMKSSKLSKKNLKYFVIYFEGNTCHNLIRNVLNEKRLEISSDVEIDMSRNVYFMLIDHHKLTVEGICKKDYMKESIDNLSKIRIYKLKLEIKSR